MNHLQETFIKYLAGFLDADGTLSFMFSKDKRRDGYYSLGLHLEVSSSEAIDHHGFVASLSELTGMGISSTDRLETKRGSGKIKCYYKWTVYKRSDLEKLLPRLLKHMAVKAKHWQWMFEIWRSRRDLPYGEKSIPADAVSALKEQVRASRAGNSGPLKPKNHPSWSWLAGYMDGNGHYRKRKHGKDISCCCHINDSQVLTFIQKALGGVIYKHSGSDFAMEWRRPLSGANRSFALRILPKLVNHSRIKKHSIEMMIHDYQQRSSEQNATA